MLMFSGDEQPDSENDLGRDSLNHGYDILKELDPAAANRIHPNNHRKVSIELVWTDPCLK